jgi:acyl-CoA thioester hydrolase
VPGRSEITILRRIEWADTDAAGIYHYATAFRLAEAAEAELHTRNGVDAIVFGSAPRVSAQFDFARPVVFNDEVAVRLVAALGRTSVTYAITITHEDEVVATGRIVAVHVDRETGRPSPWPDVVRDVLQPA